MVVTRDTVLRDLRRVQKSAEADGSHPSALRSIELTAKLGGVTPPSEQAKGRGAEEGRSLSPAEVFGLPDTTR